jgi:DNA replication and repair protein RecF
VELRHLSIGNLRVIEQQAFDLTPGWNLFIGPNGAGKTSLLEAVFLLSHGRSFRSGGQDALVRQGTSGYVVYGELARAAAPEVRRVGLARTGARLEARVNGESVGVAELLHETAVVCFEPGSHELICGASEERRRFLDWGVFHVEHDFLAHWRRYQRALKQRNALLRGEIAELELDVWDAELARFGEPLSRMRQEYFNAFVPQVNEVLRELLPELGQVQLEFHPGFDPEHSLEQALAQRRGRDLARGHTSAGPHRADWSIGFTTAVRREHLSRGQEKLCALACVIAQARLFAEHIGEWPILCLDDLASEVDAAHQERVGGVVAALPAQILATATEESIHRVHPRAPAARFHVEHGHIKTLL